MVPGGDQANYLFLRAELKLCREQCDANFRACVSLSSIHCFRVLARCLAFHFLPCVGRTDCAT